MHRKTGIHGRVRPISAVIVRSVTGENLLIEDLPEAERTVAAQIKLSCADAANRHPDRLQLLAR